MRFTTACLPPSRLDGASIQRSSAVRITDSLTADEIAMSLGEDSGSSVDFETMRGRDYPTILQFTVFMENRVGSLSALLRKFRNTSVRIVALNIQDSTECCIVRFVFSHPEQAREILERAGLSIIEGDLIAVILPEEAQPMLTVCNALLEAEINLTQSYPLLVRSGTQMAISLMVDNIELAQQTLANHNFHMLTEHELLDMC